MSRTSQLFDLQQIDSGLDSRLSRMREIDAQMVDSRELVEARQARDDERDTLATRQSTLKDLSHEAEEVAARLKAQEKRLYDGSVKNPKELAQIQEEVWHLKSRRKDLEDLVLDAMMAAEEAEGLLTERTAACERVESDWQQFQDGLLEEKDKLAEQSKVLQVKRQKAISEVPWSDLQAYERLRRSKGGLAVAAVQNGMCSGCRVGVPAHVLRMARNSTEFVPCPSCGRILYPTGEVKFKEFDHNLDNINR